MSILVDQTTRLVVQGIAGRRGMWCVERMLSNGAQVVAGVSMGYGGSWISGIPVFDSVQEAVRATAANVSVLYTPVELVQEGIIEAADAGLRLVVCITSDVPAWAMMRVKALLKHRSTLLLGPNAPGAFSPGRCLAGVIPPNIVLPGDVGVVTRSGSLLYETTLTLTLAGLGQSTALCIGSGLLAGMGFREVLEMFEQDAGTHQVVMIGEIGGQEEEAAAEWIADRMTKPVVTVIAGQTSPPGRVMGHTGAIIEGVESTAQSKMDILARSGAQIAHTIHEIPALLNRLRNH